MNRYEFYAGGLVVSMAEMNANPERTVEIVHELAGWHWASRLWQHWHNTLSQEGAQNIPLWGQSDRIRKWLDDRRPEEARQ